ncbi:unnamed protein product [Dovyalis caffra]|uniref:Uncharacterized protein n=1 Tax=Dovyalis caffra TaxID=77055 RepID=A0AAV1RRR5_9ROSI|nr:unnamed protein product [Dovyalis caffra]
MGTMETQFNDLIHHQRFQRFEVCVSKEGPTPVHFALKNLSSHRNDLTTRLVLKCSYFKCGANDAFQETNGTKLSCVLKEAISLSLLVTSVFELKKIKKAKNQRISLLLVKEASISNLLISKLLDA